MSEATPPDFLKVRRILMPFAFDSTEKIDKSKVRFAYYTSADTACRVLRNKEIWLRDATTMNDFSEIRFGWERFQEASSTPEAERFRIAIDSLFAGLVQEVGKDIADWMTAVHRDTYIACVSEHPQEEDKHGRLSMWRAYGGKSGVALVFNRGIGEVSSNALGVYAYPVMYSENNEVAQMLGGLADRVNEEQDYVSGLGRDYVKNILLHTLLFGLLSTKHKAFLEEREWRVIACPNLHPVPHLVRSVETVRGVPQTVLKVKLIDKPEYGISGLELDKILDKVIIGPCDFPAVVAKALATELDNAGVANSAARIHVSNIPLRHF